MLSIGATIGVKAQVVAVGRVSAEVVESVSATSSAVTMLQFNTANNNNNTTGKDFSLGEVKVNSGDAVLCNVMMTSGNLSDVNGNELVIDTAAFDGGQNSSIIGGNTTLNIKGRAQSTSDQSVTGVYQGTYKMVFAYN